MPAYEIETTRFGVVPIEAGDVVHFPEGLPGFEDSLDWALLAESDAAELGWLQSLDCAEVAVAVVNPRMFVADYEVRVARGELQKLAIDSPQDACVLTTLSKDGGRLSLNLKAPLLINIHRRVARQVVNLNDF